MIEEIAFSSDYWIAVILILGISAWSLGSRALDFRWMVLLFTSQYVVHAWLSFGVLSNLTWFVTCFHLIFLGFMSRLNVFIRPAPGRTTFNYFVSNNSWINCCRAYIIIYYASRLIFYPYFSSEFDIGARLEAQQSNLLIFNAGLAIMPALAGFFYHLVKPDKRVGLVDWITLTIAAIGMLGAGSKSGILFIIIGLLGVISYRNLSLRAYGKIIFLMLVCLAFSALMLIRFFPDLPFEAIFGLVLFRIVANTDSLEYLKATMLSPSDYPYSGAGALFPFLFKRLGYQYDVPPGVWLHGVRFGNWEGFGPNPGIVMDYFANLGWLGLVVPVLLGCFVRKAQLSASPIGCSFLAMTLYAVIDVTVFDICLVIWSLVYVSIFYFGLIKAGMLLGRHRRTL